MRFDFITLPPRIAARLGLPKDKSIPITEELRGRLEEEGPSLEVIVAGCEAYLEVDPDDEHYRTFVGKYYHHRGVTLANEGRLEEAFELFGKARLLEGSETQVHLDYGRAALELERPEEAIEGYRAAMAAGVRSPELYDGLARAFAVMGDFKSAMGVAEQSRKEFPDSPVPLQTLTTLYYHSGDKISLEKLLFDQVARDPENPLTLEKLSVYFRESGRFPEAARAIRRALELAPGQRRLVYQRGMVEFRGSDFKAAEETFTTLLEDDPSNLDVRNALAALYAETSRPDEAERVWEETALLAPRDYRAHFHLGRMAARSADRIPEALSHFERVLELKPRDRQALHYIYIHATNAGAEGVARLAEAQMRVMGEKPVMEEPQP